MKKHHLLLSLVLLSSIIFFSSCKKQEPKPAKESTPVSTSAKEISETTIDGEKIQLGIVYAGHPGSDREKDFVNFLNKHFTKVETSDLAIFNGSQSEGFDVTILDYDGDGFKSPRPQIPGDFSRPVMTMGVTGAFICGSRNLKTSYL